MDLIVDMVILALYVANEVNINVHKREQSLVLECNNDVVTWKNVSTSEIVKVGVLVEDEDIMLIELFCSSKLTIYPNWASGLTSVWSEMFEDSSYAFCDALYFNYHYSFLCFYIQDFERAIAVDTKLLNYLEYFSVCPPQFSKS